MASIAVVWVILPRRNNNYRKAGRLMGQFLFEGRRMAFFQPRLVEHYRLCIRGVKITSYPL